MINVQESQAAAQSRAQELPELQIPKAPPADDLPQQSEQHKLPQPGSVEATVSRQYFADAHKHLAQQNQLSSIQVGQCFLHPNPSMLDASAIFCDRVMSNRTAIHAYLYNVASLHKDKYNLFAECKSLPGWQVCGFKAGAEDIAQFELPDFDDTLVECACQLLDMLTNSDNGFPPEIQFEAAYLSVYLHYQQREFNSASDLAAFFGPYFLAAWPIYQCKRSVFLDDVYQQIFEAAMTANRFDDQLSSF